MFFPLGSTPTEIALSLLLFLNVVHIGYSFAIIAYQAWGAELGATDEERSTFVAMREGIGILGVVFAVALPLQSNGLLLFGVFACMLAMGMCLLLKFARALVHCVWCALAVRNWQCVCAKHFWKWCNPWPTATLKS
ncbi:MAG: hypothetical protein HC848_05090 [Limnobacter sp.]|nr:hypothetical protein [Limnobacter sp.]